MNDPFEEIEQQMLKNFNETYEQCIDMLASATERWPSDSSTDLLARGIIGTMRPLLDSLHIVMARENRANNAVFNTALSLYGQLAHHITALNDLGRLRDDK